MTHRVCRTNLRGFQPRACDTVLYTECLSKYYCTVLIIHA